LKKALVSAALKAYTNLLLLLVPILQVKTASCEKEDIKRAIARHTTVLQSISKTFSSKILSLNRPLLALNNTMLCTTLMAVTTSDGKKLFLSVDPTWNGQGFNISYPTIYAAQAHDYVEYLPAYLSHSHGNEVYRWFTPDAVAEAKTMGWDDQKNQPISPDGLDLRNTLQSLNLEWCIAMPMSANNGVTAAMDLDAIMLPSFNTLNQQPTAQPGIPSVAPIAAPMASSVASVTTHEDLKVASMVDTHLSALECSCTLLPQILQWLNALAPLPTNSSGTGSIHYQ